MTRKKKPFYELPPPKNGLALEQARGVSGLEEEIALLRATLRRFARQDQADDGLILAAINTLARTLMAQARIKGVDPGDTRRRLAAAIRQLGGFLEEDQAEETGREPTRQGRARSGDR